MEIEAVLGTKAPQAKNFRVFLGVKSAAGEKKSGFLKIFTVGEKVKNKHCFHYPV